MTVDVDPDEATFGIGHPTLSWSSLALLPRIRAVLADVACPITWFLRCDDLVADCHGSYTYLYDREQPFWESATAAGDELGIHPHFCVKDSISSLYSRVHAPDLSRFQLTRAHEALRNAGVQTSSIRVGESFHCNELMLLIDELGYRVDSTAIPGRRRHDTERVFDWVGTPNHPYRPSLSDYRKAGTPALSLLEVPMTSMLFKADYDSKPMLRYASLTYRTDIFSAGLRDFLRSPRNSQDLPLVFIIHPAELNERLSSDSLTQLYSFDIKSLRRNVDLVLQVIAECGGTYTFSTLRTLASEWPEAAA